jgi:hypothetical protein
MEDVFECLSIKDINKFFNFLEKDLPQFTKFVRKERYDCEEA